MVVLLAALGMRCGTEDARPPADAPQLAVAPELRESPVLEALLAAFAQECGVRVAVLPSPEGAAVLLAPPKEPGTDLEGPQPEGRDIFWTSYVLLGPPEGETRSYGEWNYQSWARGRSPVVGGRGPIHASSASRLFQEIALSAFPFVSQGDGSAVHVREMQFWGERGPSRGIEWPSERDGARRTDGPGTGASYAETRETMDRTVAIADQRSAYALCDVATYLRLRNKVRLAVVLARDAELRVPYRATLAESPAGPRERYRGAKRFYDWLGSENCRAVLQKVRVDGERPFYAPGEDLAPALRGRLDPEPPYDDEPEDEGR